MIGDLKAIHHQVSGARYICFVSGSVQECKKGDTLESLEDTGTLEK